MTLHNFAVTVPVRMGGGSPILVQTQVKIEDPNKARQLVEAQYGVGNVINVRPTQYPDRSPINTVDWRTLMRMVEIASAKEQITLFRFISDKVWASLAQQKQAKAALKPHSKCRVSKNLHPYHNLDLTLIRKPNHNH